MVAKFAEPHQPVLILGGFLIDPGAYRPMAERLRVQLGQPVQVVPANRFDWLATVGRWGWARLLDRVDQLARELAAASPTGRITLIGHSSGGVMLRLWLSEEPFGDRVYGGQRLADRLITLGSPHTALRATALRQWVDRRLPGAFCAPEVHYAAVAGQLDPASPLASATSRRLASRSYAAISGDPAVAGDGLVPVTSALLAGAEHLVLDGVAHGGAFGRRWYGTPEVVDQWWPLLGGA
jgi:hypothetical protein